jgi:hypothetical protein
MQILGITLTALAVSFVFSMVGSGGSQVMVPALFWLGLPFKSGAIPLALLESAVTSISAGAVYVKKGLVTSSSTVLPFAIPVLIGAPIGALVNFTAKSNVLMIVFAISNMIVGIAVLRGQRVVERELSRRAVTTIGIILGFGVGFVLGMIGRDGGPFVVLVLVLMGFEAKEAAGTSTLIIAAGCLAAFLTHLPKATVGWEAMLAGSLACLVGSQIGSRVMSERLNSKAVRILFASVMFVVGVVILIQAF